MSPAGKFPHYYLRPAEMVFSEMPILVSTVLGSCLSITMFHRHSTTAAICHGLLPTCGEKKKCPGCASCFKYVDCSIRRMVERFDERRVGRGEIEVKLFGGANMFGEKVPVREFNVGARNISRACEVVEEEGLKIAAFHTGGRFGRRIVFNTNTGEVLMKKLERNGVRKIDDE